MKRGLFGLPHAPTLAHFTRASANGRALDNLIRILETGMLAGATRMVRGGQRAVCLFDAPMAELKRLLRPRNRRRYEPFGVAVDKRYAFIMGARPVIYMPAGEARTILKPEQMWRVVSIELDRARPVDWTFEREWRVAGDLPLKPALCVALVHSWRDAEEIFDRFAGRPPCAGVIPLDGIFES